MRNHRTEETETARSLEGTQTPLLTLRLLYSGEAGIVTRPGELLDAGSLAIGRAVEEGLSLPEDRRASRHHATIEVRGSRSAHEVSVVDQGSKNGTFVNGRRVNEARLREGDLLRIGDSFLLLRTEPIAAAVDRPVAGLIGLSPAMRLLRREIHQIAPAPSTVLLLGETGTGKEVCAQALHRLSGRSQQPLVVLDSGAVPRSLIESELFGHEAGAFTGAQRQRQGLFEQAHGGTLFIDELGELPLELQPMLLRALEQGTVRRVGGGAPLKTDVRVIAATHRDLLKMVDEQRFRPDLYARLCEVQLHLPPLRERSEDVLVLLANALGAAPAPRFSPDLVEALLLHRWPFNVREVVKLAGELRARGAGQPVLGLDLVHHRLQGSRSLDKSGERSGETSTERTAGESGPESPALERREAPPTRAAIEQLLAESGGVISEMARRLGCSRKQVYRYLEQHGLSLSDYR